MSNEILINQLFAGRYLEEGENIGHEVINLFRDDEGNNNLYITPSGTVNGHEIESVLFVRNVSARKTVEVIAMAQDLQCITEEQVDRIRYAGVSLNQIFNNNLYHGGVDTLSKRVTFRAGRVLLPSRRIFITLDRSFDNEEYTLCLNSERQVVIPQKMREYYSDRVDVTAYAQLKELINDGKLWEKDNTTEKLFPDGAVINRAPSFLEVIRKEDDEVIFSNLLGYFFEYSHCSFQQFAADPNLLDIPDMSSSFVVLRETVNRIDLWIEGDKDIIVIENKIKSGINGVTRDDYSQLNKYYETAQKEAEKKNKKTHYYIFAPDYARFDLAQYGVEDIYKVVKYSDIYKFFIRESETYIADRTFPDFVRGLKRHTLTFAELQFNTMRSRLIETISKLQ